MNLWSFLTFCQPNESLLCSQNRSARCVDNLVTLHHTLSIPLRPPVHPANLLLSTYNKQGHERNKDKGHAAVFKMLFKGERMLANK